MPRSSNRKRAARALQHAHPGLTYQQALAHVTAGTHPTPQAPTPQAPEHAGPSAGTLPPVDLAGFVTAATARPLLTDATLDNAWHADGLAPFTRYQRTGLTWAPDPDGSDATPDDADDGPATWYPLTPDEARYVADDRMVGPFTVAYASALQTPDGRWLKALTPVAELAYRDPGTPPQVYLPDRDATLTQAHATVAAVTPWLRTLGGVALVLPDNADSAHIVEIVVPLDTVMAAYPDPDDWYAALDAAVNALPGPNTGHAPDPDSPTVADNPTVADATATGTPDVRYRLTVDARGRTAVTVHRPDRDYPLSHLVKHSPTGMTWGYGGSGPADLARSLLTDAAGPHYADNHYQRFKWDVIAVLDQDASHTVTGGDIAAWADRAGTGPIPWQNGTGDLRSVYPDGVCPDCGTPIPADADDGDECAACGHVFTWPRPDDAP